MLTRIRIESFQKNIPEFHFSTDQRIFTHLYMNVRRSYIVLRKVPAPSLHSADYHRMWVPRPPTSALLVITDPGSLDRSDVAGFMLFLRFALRLTRSTKWVKKSRDLQLLHSNSAEAACLSAKAAKERHALLSSNRPKHSRDQSQQSLAFQ